MSGPSRRPDPTTHAYRRDLADIALAGVVIAPHYARAIERQLARPETLRREASVGSDPVATLEAGEPFLLLEESPGWAWGYGGPDRKVGYVPSDALSGN